MRNIKYYEYCHQEYMAIFPQPIQDIVNKSKENYKLLLDDNNLHQYEKPEECIDEYKEKLFNIYQNKISGKIRKKLYELANYICPYCSLGTTETLDHFLPKAEYPELAVVCYNLVPACYACNCLHKKYYIIDFNYHPYASIDYSNYLSLKISLENNKIIFQYKLSIENNEKLKIFLEKLELCNRYQEKVRSIFQSLSINWKDLSCSILIQRIECRKEEATFEWEKLFYTKLLGNIKDVYYYLQSI